MARKAEKRAVHTALPKGWPEPPFLLNDITSMVGNRPMVMERTVGGWRAIAAAPAVYHYLTDITILDSQCSRQASKVRRFHPWEHNVNVLTGDKRSFQDHLAGYKRLALQEGATPEAIRLLDIHEPLTEQEVLRMAKAKEAKDAPKKLAKKDAGGDAGKTETKRKGNPEALAKAREAAKDRGPDVRKITVLKKENPYRADSNRAKSFDALKGAKTVEDYKSAGGAVKYIARWEADGTIKLS